MKFKFFLGSIAIFILVWMISIFLYISLKMYDSSLQNADVAIVLGAGTDGKQPSAVFQERLNHAVLLFNQKRVQFIILTGGYGKNSSIADSRIARAYLLSLNIPANHIITEEKSTLTYTNLVYAQEIMLQMSFKTALIVSDPHHIPRALAMCKRLNIQAFPSPTQTSKYKSTSKKFWAILNECFFFTGGFLVGNLSLF